MEAVGTAGHWTKSGSNTQSGDKPVLCTTKTAHTIGLLTMDKPEQTLQENLEKIAKEYDYKNYQIIKKKISSGGANYTSHLYLATIKAPEKDDLKLFIKTAAVGEKMRAETPIKIFETENLFYNKLNNKYKQLEDKMNIPIEHRFVTPKFYGGSDEYFKETLVLEDLSAKGYTTHDRFKSIEWEYASKSLENLAKFHALSIALSVHDPEGFEEMSILKVHREVDESKAYYRKIFENALEMTREENRDRFSKFLIQLGDNKDIDRFYRHRNSPVIMHGDYRPSNLMHKNSEVGMKVVSVDYQMLELGNPIIDILYFILIGSDKKFRDQHFKQSLDHYYNELCKALKRFELEPEDMYSREDFDINFREVLPMGLVLSVFCLMVVTVEEEEAPELREDFSLEDFTMDPNSLYKERLNDIIDDYISLGVI